MNRNSFQSLDSFHIKNIMFTDNEFLIKCYDFKLKPPVFLKTQSMIYLLESLINFKF